MKEIRTLIIMMLSTLMLTGCSVTKIPDNFFIKENKNENVISEDIVAVISVDMEEELKSKTEKAYDLLKDEGYFSLSSNYEVLKYGKTCFTGFEKPEKLPTEVAESINTEVLSQIKVQIQLRKDEQQRLAEEINILEEENFEQWKTDNFESLNNNVYESKAWIYLIANSTSSVEEWSEYNLLKQWALSYIENNKADEEVDALLTENLIYFVFDERFLLKLSPETYHVYAKAEDRNPVLSYAIVSDKGEIHYFTNESEFDEICKILYPKGEYTQEYEVANFGYSASYNVENNQEFVTLNIIDNGRNATVYFPKEEYEGLFNEKLIEAESFAEYDKETENYSINASFNSCQKTAKITFLRNNEDFSFGCYNYEGLSIVFY